MPAQQPGIPLCLCALAQTNHLLFYGTLATTPAVGPFSCLGCPYIRFPFPTCSFSSLARWRPFTAAVALVQAAIWIYVSFSVSSGIPLCLSVFSNTTVYAPRALTPRTPQQVTAVYTCTYLLQFAGRSLVLLRRLNLFIAWNIITRRQPEVCLWQRERRCSRVTLPAQFEQVTCLLGSGFTHTCSSACLSPSPFLPRVLRFTVQFHTVLYAGSTTGSTPAAAVQFSHRSTATAPASPACIYYTRSGRGWFSQWVLLLRSLNFRCCCLVPSKAASWLVVPAASHGFSLHEFLDSVRATTWAFLQALPGLPPAFPAVRSACLLLPAHPFCSYHLFHVTTRFCRRTDCCLTLPFDSCLRSHFLSLTCTSVSVVPFDSDFCDFTTYRSLFCLFSGSTYCVSSFSLFLRTLNFCTLRSTAFSTRFYIFTTTYRSSAGVGIWAMFVLHTALVPTPPFVPHHVTTFTAVPPRLPLLPPLRLQHCCSWTRSMLRRRPFHHLYAGHGWAFTLGR